MTTTARGYVLDRTPPPPYDVPVLDPSQQAVADHPGGPLLVLAGPGTGKTTTLVEAVAARIARGTSPDQILVLTFSRKAADELRERISRRLHLAGAAATEPSAWTFHAWCLAVLRAYRPPGAREPRLLSGPERLVRVREILRGHLAGAGATRWPAALRPALETRGFARELADLVDRARERGLEPADLRALGEQAGRADWQATAQFAEEYVEVLGLAGELDYGELVRQALRLVDDHDDVRAELRNRYQAVFVDEYQDTDPAQERMLALLCGGGRDLVVVGDPDQSVYAFRGAEVSGLLQFPERFRRADGGPAETTALTVSRRAGRELLAVSRRVAARVPTPGVPVAALRRHRDLEPAGGVGAAEVRMFATSADEATAIADLLRREHLEHGRPWRDMAVVVRSGTRSLPLLRRALVAAGVPVAVAADEVPVARDPAVRPLLLALRVAQDSSVLDEEAARTLLLSPLGRATPAGLRRLGRALRALERDRLAARRPVAGDTADETAYGTGDDIGAGLPRPSAALLRAALVDPRELVELPERDVFWARPVERVWRVLRAARRVLDDGGGADEALWAIWEGSGLARRLPAAAAGGGQEGRDADRDLDAVVALFDEVGRLVERVPRAGVDTLLDALLSQEIPSASRTEGRLAAAGAVRLLTAHRSKGLEWGLVVVAGVQDGVWPDLRRRGSLLGADRLTGDPDVAPTTTALLVEERRLFYVALTRARERLVVTAVESPDDDGERASRFLDELGLPVPVAPERPTAVLSAAGLAGRLRHAVLTADHPQQRRGAASCLALLAGHVPAADPSHWWGLLDWTTGAAPVRPPDAAVALSGSAVAGYETCPLKWFLQREARAAEPTTTAQGFGLVLHALARLVADGRVPADADAVMSRLDEVWDGLGFDAPWFAHRERREARAAVERFLRHHAAQPRRLVAAEHPFEVDWTGLDESGRPVRARLRGSMDRVEVDDEGRLHVVDLKTGGLSSVPTNADVERHPQLGVYQVAIREGAVEPAPVEPAPVEPLGDTATPGGAELWHLRKPAKGGGPAVQAQPGLDPSSSWADEMLTRVATGVLGERFPARRNPGCDRCQFRGSCPAQDAGGAVVA